MGFVAIWAGGRGVQACETEPPFFFLYVLPKARILDPHIFLFSRPTMPFIEPDLYRTSYGERA